MQYRELREMERLLAAYMVERPAESTVVPALQQVLLAVARHAGRVQNSETRLCCWCGTHHHDRGVDLCADCAHRAAGGT